MVPLWLPPAWRCTMQPPSAAWHPLLPLALPQVIQGAPDLAGKRASHSPLPRPTCPPFPLPPQVIQGALDMASKTAESVMTPLSKVGCPASRRARDNACA